MKNRFAKFVSTVMPCCILGLLMIKPACAINRMKDEKPPLFYPDEFSSKYFQRLSTSLDDMSFRYDEQGEIQAPVLYKQSKNSDRTRFVMISTSPANKKKKQGLRIRGLTFYYMPDTNTQWRLKLRKNKVQIRFKYEFN